MLVTSAHEIENKKYLNKKIKEGGKEKNERTENK